MTASVFSAFSRGAVLTLLLWISLVRCAAAAGNADWTAAQSGPEVPLATLFPIPGGTWTRSEGPTFRGFAPAEGPAAAYTATAPESGGAWMSLSLSGPGILRFVAEPCFSGVPVDSTLSVEVNGTVQREVESDLPWQNGLTFQSPPGGHSARRSAYSHMADSTASGWRAGCDLSHQKCIFRCGAGVHVGHKRRVRRPACSRAGTFGNPGRD